MSKYAIMVPCSANYLPGLNALLNGLDLFENTADVWVIEENIPEEYKEKAKKVFNFRVEFVPIADMLKGEYCLNAKIPSSFYRWVFSPYVLQLRLKDEYDVVAFIGADMPIVNNIMKWFEVAEKTGFIVTADNPYTLTQITDIPKVMMGLNGLLSSDPIADAPAFMNPKLHQDVIEKILTLSGSTSSTSNMNVFSSALYTLKKTDRVLTLNSQLWTCGIYYSFRTYYSKGVNGKFFIFAENERVNAIHKKYWIDGVIYSAIYDKIPGTWAYDNTLANLKLWCHIYRKLNTNYKIKYDYPENTIFERIEKSEVLLKYQKIAQMEKDNKK